MSIKIRRWMANTYTIGSSKQNLHYSRVCCHLILYVCSCSILFPILGLSFLLNGPIFLYGWSYCWYFIACDILRALIYTRAFCTDSLAHHRMNMIMSSSLMTFFQAASTHHLISDMSPAEPVIPFTNSPRSPQLSLGSQCNETHLLQCTNSSPMSLSLSYLPIKFSICACNT